MGGCGVDHGYSSSHGRSGRINNFNERVCRNSQRNTFWQIICVFSFLILPKKKSENYVFFWKNTRPWRQCTSLCVTSHQCWSLSWLIKHWAHSGIGLTVHPPPSNKGHPDMIPTYLRCPGNPDIYHLFASSSPKPRFLSRLGLTRSTRKGRSSIILFHYFWLFVLSSSYE